MLQCIYCGQEFENQGRRKKDYCMECAFKRAEEAARQIMAREGPYFEQWLDSKAKAVENYRKSMEKAIKRYEASYNIIEHLSSPVGQAEMLIRLENLRNALED